jgi:glycosyltransferase involved in cell wall biosynthesis
MRILMTSDTYLPLLGGGEYHVRYVRDELQKLGLSVRLFTTYPADAATTDDAGIVRVRYAGFASVPSVFLALWRESKGVDLIHSHYSYRLAFLAGTVARLRGIPFVITQHGLGLLPQAGSRPWQTVLFRLWRRWSMACANLVISTSDDLSIDIRNLGYGSKIVHIPNGFDASGANLPTLSSVDKLVAEGFLQANGSSHKERFVLVPNCMRVPTGELNDAGKAATRNVPDGTHRAQVTLSLKDGKDGTVRMTLSFKEDGEGRWIPTLQVSRPSGGPRGAIKKAPVSEDELF